MSELRPGDRATIQRISDADPDLLHYLSSIGLTLNSRVTVLSASPLDGNLHLEIGEQGTSFVLGERITRQIFVQPE
jgi:DtxR family Mn-dependent transcriptional regulator